MAYGYFKIRTQYILNLGVRKPLLDGKMILTVNLDDILRSSGDLDCVSVSGDHHGHPPFSTEERLVYNVFLDCSASFQKRYVNPILTSPTLPRTSILSAPKEKSPVVFS